MTAAACPQPRMTPDRVMLKVTPATPFVLALRQATALQGLRRVAAPGPGDSMQDSFTEPTASQAARDKVLAALLSSAAAGDAKAFEQFYNATVRYAMAVARRIAGNHAEDVLADAYFQAWQAAAQFDPARGSPLAWLVTIARSRALDRLRQETLRHGGLPGAPDSERLDAPDAAPGPDELLESVQAHSRLHGALAQLSANERGVLGLAYFRDCSQTEVAAITGLPLGTVKSLMTRAQHKLRAVLQEERQPAPPALAR
jgi:RNA polymerase sigma-70 factor, ECF subfamily